MLRLIELEKNVVEGGGAVGVAALLQGLLPELKVRTIVVPMAYRGRCTHRRVWARSQTFRASAQRWRAL